MGGVLARRGRETYAALFSLGSLGVFLACFSALTAFSSSTSLSKNATASDFLNLIVLY
jgi:hypothetical protein